MRTGKGLDLSNSSLVSCAMQLNLALFKGRVKERLKVYESNEWTGSWKAA